MAEMGTISTRRTRARRLAVRIAAGAALVVAAAGTALAHPLGNFTINQFDRVEVGPSRAAVRHVVDMAEIPTLQEMPAIDTDADGAPSAAELDAYARAVGERISGEVALSTDGERVPLALASARAALNPGAGGLSTLRIELELTGALPDGHTGSGRARFENAAFADRIGWREIVLAPADGAALFDASGFGNSLSDELRSYPADSLTAPLDERRVEFSYAAGGVREGATALRLRDGREAVQTRDRLAELIAVRELTPLVALVGLLIAFGLGGLHALSPGHGKTVVGAYLVGSRGTARHAAFLGLTVTVTHTAGVFALGVVTLFASQYVLPERLYPVLSLASGAIVLAMGLSLFVGRLRSALGMPEHDHGHEHHHDHDPAAPHSHGGRAHSHMPPGVAGERVTWRSLLALGVSGGLLPCPSALVVLLSAISLHRVGYGLLLVVAFSAGLAGVLTAIGMAFVYAGRLFKSAGRVAWLARVMPVVSSLVIAAVGAAICLGALEQAGYGLTGFVAYLQTSAEDPSFQNVSALGILGLGLVFGLKHATEADHVVAVSTIVSEHRNVAKAALVGGLWGLGHTLSLVVVGAFVLALRITIPDSVANWLEFGVALMIITLGASALMRGLRNRSGVHIHRHDHDGHAHAHLHFHETADGHAADGRRHSHAVRRIGLKPLVVGAVHGLAGSAALTLLVLTQIGSAALGLLYLGVFGVGSIGGMLIMSGLVGLPFAVTSNRLGRFHHALQLAAGAFSLAFGLWYAYETGAASGLLFGILR